MMGFGSLAMTGGPWDRKDKGKGKEKEKVEVEVGKKQGRAREISKNSLVKDLVPQKKHMIILSPEPDIAPLASGSNPTRKANPVKIPPAAPEQPVVGSGPAQESGSAIEPVAVAPAGSAAIPVNAVAIKTNLGAVTALECFRQADADFEEAQRRRKAAMGELLRAQEAELAKTQERFFCRIRVVKHQWY
jgi:hypothetical protein